MNAFFSLAILAITVDFVIAENRRFSLSLGESETKCSAASSF